MSDPSKRHQREKEIFLQAMDITDQEERERFLEQTCGGDADLLARVDALLNIEERSGLLEPSQDVRGAFDALVETQKDFTSSSKHDWLPPEVSEINGHFEGFEVKSLIGKGGMGAVYLATQTSLERSVAIKLLLPEFAEEPTFAERFRQEALAMAKLDHPNIVSILDFGQTADYFYIVMEFVAGADLHQMISTGDLNPENALQIVSQICEALQYSHDQGLVHRDIKPANIFVTPTGVVKVGDFGLARLASDSDKRGPQLTQSGFRVGTPDYMAPESLDQKAVDHRADIYSLGVLFYEMLTGSVPRGAFAPPSSKVEVDSRVDQVVLKAMSENPESRQQQASEVRSEVNTISKDQTHNQAIRSGTKVGQRLALGVLSICVLASVAWICFKIFELDRFTDSDSNKPIELWKLVDSQKDTKLGTLCEVVNDQIILKTTDGYHITEFPTPLSGSYRFQFSLPKKGRGLVSIRLPIEQRIASINLWNTGMVTLNSGFDDRSSATQKAPLGDSFTVLKGIG